MSAVRALNHIQDEIESAKRAFTRHRAAPPRRNAVYRSTPGCAHYCTACDIACAVIVSIIHDLEDEYRQARASAAALMLTYDTDADIIYVDAAA